MIEIVHMPEPHAWDAYVAEHDGALFSHGYAWAETLAAVYGLPMYLLAARCRGHRSRIAGVAPFLLFSPPGAAGRLISLPYTDAAGILADDAAVRTGLLAAALDQAAKLGAVHLELRQAGESSLPDWHASDRWQHAAHSFKTGLRRRLPGSSAALWALLSSKVRNQVRKARRCGCTARIGGVELVDPFYAVFSENMRDLGSPVHAFELFEELAVRLSQGMYTIVVYCGAVPAAVAMVFEHNGTLYNPWASSLRRLRPFCPNMLLYWTMLAHGVDRGCRWFDFGRSSPDASTCRFKLQWGAKMEPLTWHIFSRKPHRWHPKSESLEDHAWKKRDLAASRRQGPGLRRWISL